MGNNGDATMGTGKFLYLTAEVRSQQWGQVNFST